MIVSANFVLIFYRQYKVIFIISPAVMIFRFQLINKLTVAPVCRLLPLFSFFLHCLGVSVVNICLTGTDHLLAQVQHCVKVVGGVTELVVFYTQVSYILEYDLCGWKKINLKSQMLAKSCLVAQVQHSVKMV